VSRVNDEGQELLLYYVKERESWKIDKLMKLSVAILGAGFGGLELSTILSEQMSDRLDITLIDRNDYFFLVFQSSM
jgi:hypothetical protein